MTREEAKRRLLDIERCTPIHTREDARDFEALEMAIQALSQEPCTDAVSRDAVKQAINCWIGSGEYRYAMSERFLIDRINDLPSVNPQPCDDAISRPSVVKFEGTNMACMGGDEIMKEFENNTQQRCDDKVISLERAKKQIGRWIGYIDQDMINRICMSLDALPPVTHKSGKWQVVSDGYGDSAYICECSECNDTVWVYKDAERRWNYCPNCGARMVEPQESEEQTE